MTDESGWDGFCGEHFEQAMKDIANKFPECEVGHSEAYTDGVIGKDYYPCGYPGCNKDPKYEVHWMDPEVFNCVKSTAYIPIKEILEED